MTEISGGTLFARALQAEGIEFLFGLPSPEIDPLLAELDAHGIRLVPVRHEAAGVHMAEGLYKTTGRVAAVLGNPGPGSANLLPGVITALHEGIPVLAITSQHRLGVVYPSPPSTFQGQDQLELFRPAVKWGGPIFQWSRIPEVMRLAFREMWNGRPGPVHIELPAPILYETGEEDSAPILPGTGSRAAGPQAGDEQLKHAAELLACGERPLVIAGSGVDRAGAGVAAIEIAEILGCPVLCTMAGRASVPSDHPNYVFGFGPAGDAARREADVILVAGSRIGNLDVPYDAYWGEAEGKRLIQIDVDPRHIGVTRPVALAILADARPALEGIAERLRAIGPTVGDGAALARYRQLDQQVNSSRPDRSCSGRDRGSTPRTRWARSAPSSDLRPSTRSMAATPRSGPTRCCPPHGRAPTTRSSSSGCSAPASPRRSGPSSARPSARSSASPGMAPRAST